jgi:transglutaminase-like putative cysteine protease
MPLRNVQKVTAYLMASLGLALLAFSGELGPVGTMLTVAAFIASWWFEEPLIATKKWSQGWNTATLAVFVLQFIRWWTGVGFVTAAVQFAAFLQINKLFNRRSQSDYDHILVLSLIHLIGSSILFSDLEYAILFIFYVIITPWHLMLGQIRREVEAKYLEKKDAESIYNFRRVLKSKRLISGRLLIGTALLSLPVYVLTAVFFLTFPRIGFGLLAGQTGLSRQSVGFSDTIELGDLVPLADNPLAVARVEFEGKAPPMEVLRTIHWRATAYDRYDGKQWLRTLSYGSTVRLRGALYLLGDDGEAAPDLGRDYIAMDITLQPLYPRVLIVPQAAPYVEMTYKQPIRVIRQRLSWGPSSEIRYSDPFDAGLSYRVYVSRDGVMREPASPFGFDDTSGAGKLAPFLQVPTLSKRLTDLAAGFAAEYPDPSERALAIASWLSSSYGYTRSEYRAVGKAGDPVEAFLFSWKEGNCEYFSTAMVLLLRAGGIPARNVAGFIGGQWNGIGSYLMIREGDAHSWVEAYLPGRGWALFDPTPSSASPEFVTNAVLSKLLLFFDVVSLAWQKHVIAYDLSRQGKFMKAGYVKLLKWRNDFQGLRKGFIYRFTEPHKRLLLVLFMLVAWFLYFASLRKESILQAPAAYRQTVSVRKAMNLMSVLDRRLELLGLQRPPSRPPLRHGSMISPNMKDPATMLDIVRIYNEARFGSRILPPAEYRGLVQKIKALE